jgi:hypothetical protein
VVEKSLSRFGRFHVFDITKGDRNKQTTLMATNSRSFLNFITGGGVAILWNIVSTVLAAILLKK